MNLQRCSSGLSAPASRTARSLRPSAVPTLSHHDALVTEKRVVATLVRQISQTSRPVPVMLRMPNDNNSLNKQRSLRPLSPHLSIYKWQITSIPSTLMRITGVAMGGTLYLFGAAYLASPYFGLDLSSASIVASFGSLSWLIKAAIKTLVAFPFTFHAFNALRFLTWDLAIGVNNKTVSKTGWSMVVASITSAIALGMWC